MIRLILLLRIFIGAVFIAMVAAVFAVSFAAIIYTGELAPYLNKGIGLALLGATILGLLGAFMMSYRGTASQPQDVPAILLAGAASVLAARNQLDGETLFATTVCLIVVSSISMGVAAIFCSRMRLAHLAKYIPYPVMAGFLAATGLLLFLGGVGIAMDESLNLETAMRLFETDNLIRWLPWSIAALLMSITTRVFSGTMTLPICISVMGGLFYLVLWGFGLNLSDARALNLLFGPFGDAWFLAGFSPNVITQADWWAVLTQIPVVLTIIMVSLVSLTLNASGIELETGEDIDLNGDMGSIGVSNIISGFLGGIPGYHHMGETLLSRRLGLKGALAGISCGVGCLLVLLFGTSILSALPMGFFAAVIMFLGLDLLYSWLWEERKNLRLRDYIVVLLIPILAITFGFLTAIAVGLFAAVIQFVLAYAKLDAIHLKSTLVNSRSYVERADNEEQVLESYGNQVVVIELSGYLFFGTANALCERIQLEIEIEMIANSIKWVVLDFHRVNGIDISALHSLQRLSSNCMSQDVQPVFTGLQSIDGGLFGTSSDKNKTMVFETLDSGLEFIEDVLLHRHAEDIDEAENFLNQLHKLYPDVDLAKQMEKIILAEDDVLINIGAPSNEMYLLMSGQLRVDIVNSNGSDFPIAKIRKGALIGEIAHYTGKTRSARIIAQTESEVLKIDAFQLDQLNISHPRFVGDFHKLVARHLARRLLRVTSQLQNIGL